jgi:hypothetical protein
MQVYTADVSKEKKERASWGSEEKREMLTVDYFFRRLMLKKKPERNKRSSVCDDSMCSSFASTPSKINYLMRMHYYMFLYNGEHQKNIS